VVLTLRRGIVFFDRKTPAYKNRTKKMLIKDTGGSFAI
jgi:hypothetical protein